MASGSGLRAGGRAQNSSAPYVGGHPFSTALSARPRIVTQTLGWMSNATIPYHWTIARWANDLDKNIMNGQIVFLKCDAGTPLLRNRAYTMLNLQMCNYSLYREEIARQRSNVLNGLNLEEEKQQPAEVLVDILNAYRPMGTVINDVNGQPDTSNNADRVVNVCISGRQTTFNIWGELHDGDYIGLKLQRIEVKGTQFNLSLKHHSVVQDDLKTISAYQWIPYRTGDANRWKTPTPNPRLTAPIHYYELGRVFRCPRGKDYELNETSRIHFAHNLSDMITKTHTFEVHLNIKA
jgi:hypothetical protein